VSLSVVKFCRMQFLLYFNLFFLGPAAASDLDLDLMRIQRNLLQEKTVEDIPKVRNYRVFAQFSPIELNTLQEVLFLKLGTVCNPLLPE
jgi:hypothetical protein